jgi:hypothetical protein
MEMYDTERPALAASDSCDSLRRSRSFLRFTEKRSARAMGLLLTGGTFVRVLADSAKTIGEIRPTGSVIALSAERV